MNNLQVIGGHQHLPATHDITRMMKRHLRDASLPSELSLQSFRVAVIRRNKTITCNIVEHITI